jgi:hypothetical protein
VGASRALRTGVVILKEAPGHLPKVPIPLLIMSVILSHHFNRLRKQVVSYLKLSDAVGVESLIRNWRHLLIIDNRSSKVNPF